MSVKIDPQQAIEGAMQVGLMNYVSELTTVRNEDEMMFENREGTLPDNLNYPFLTYRFNDEGQIDGKNPPAVDVLNVVDSVNSNFDSDILYEAHYDWDTQFTITVYDRMTYPPSHADHGEIDLLAKYRIGKIAREVHNWFNLVSEPHVDPLDGSLNGLWWTRIDPDTGEWVDQSNPPDTSVFAELLVTGTSRINNRTMILEEARGEHRRQFTVRIGGINAFELRVPTIEVVHFDPELTQTVQYPTDSYDRGDEVDPEIVFVE